MLHTHLSAENVNLYVRFSNYSRPILAIYQRYVGQKILICIPIDLFDVGSIHVIIKFNYEFPTSILKSIYNTFILPHLNYCVLCWGSQTNRIHLLQQDAREAMRVVFSVLTKRICMHKTKFLMNIFKYCLKIILNSMNLQIATQLIIMFNF